MVAKVSIGGRAIGDGEPCFIIAEAGSNHSGNLEQAFRLVDVAVKAGVDAVKFQLFRASRLYPKSAGVSNYLKQDKPIYEIVKELEMPYDWLPKLSAYCKSKRTLFLASVFDEESADQLNPYVESFKIASYEMTHVDLIRHVAQKGKPVIVSTGTANVGEIAETVQEFRKTGNDGLILMHCTAAYPAPLESLNVRAIANMKSKFVVPVGLSDHSRDPIIGPLLALAVGAALIEKHFTLSNSLPGPDHKYALEPGELELMVRSIRKAEKALGTGEKAVQKVEAELRGFARRSIFAIRNISAGEAFSRQNTAILRCGSHSNGLPPKAYSSILGRRAKRDISAESTVQQGDVL
jgi:N-acetylneuraminate synthase